MAAPKFKEFFDLMISQNKQLFDEFQTVHTKYVEDPKKWQDEFNRIGRDVQDVVRDYENRLCRQSEGSGYSKFSTKLSEKFQYEVKRHFPKYDFIGSF